MPDEDDEKQEAETGENNNTLETPDGKKHRLVVLPTGKPHVSFSEVSCWMACSWRHKKKHVDKIDLSKPNIHPIFGSAAHAVLEDYITTRVMKPKLAFQILKEEFDKHLDEEGFTLEDFKTCVKQLKEIFDEIPAWLDKAFPGWEALKAEEMLYEPIADRPYAFKGYIDAVIKVPQKGKKDKYLIWLLDWKTVVSFWRAEKKVDPKVTYQLVYYKSFWAKKMNVPLKDVRCAFVLLKRNAKVGNKIESVPVSVGETTEERALKTLNNMIASVNRGIALKNRNECKWCDYRDTEHCK